jgi:hypothetical protein
MVGGSAFGWGAFGVLSVGRFETGGKAGRPGMQARGNRRARAAALMLSQASGLGQSG